MGRRAGPERMMSAGEPVVFRNGSWIPQSQAAIALNDLGFLQGVTVTDLIRTIGGTPYLARRHIDRFCGTLDSLGIPRHPSATPGRLEELVAELARRNLAVSPPGTELGLVLLGTPGPLEHYLSGPSDPGPTLILHSFPIPKKRYATWFATGASLRVSTVRQIPADCFSPRHKVRSRLHWWLADKEVRSQEPSATALLCNEKGEVLETALAHLVAVIDNQLVTPPAEDVLSGVTLETLREVARQEEISLNNKNITKEDLFQASEILLTGTMFCLAGVSRYEGRPVPWPGPILGRLQKRWWGEIGQNLSAWFLIDP